MYKCMKGIYIIFGLVFITAILALNAVKAEEPPNESIIIKVMSTDGLQEVSGIVLEDGNGENAEMEYIIKIENKDSSRDRNVTMKFAWIEELEGWNYTAKPGSVTVGNNDTGEVKIIVTAPENTQIDQKTMLKVYAWEYEETNNEPDLEDKNTTLGVDGGELLLTTYVVPSERVEINYSVGNDRKTGYPTQVTRFNLTVKNTGYFEKKFSLIGKVLEDEDDLWDNAIVFYPTDLTEILKWNEESQVNMDVKAPSKVEAGMHTITVTANTKLSSGFLDVILDIPEPDLFIEKEGLYFSHDSMLEGQTLTIYVKVGNKGSIVTEKFSVEVSVKNPDGGWILVGTENITELKYGSEKIVGFNYKVQKTGELTFLAKVNSGPEQDTLNNAQEGNVYVVSIVNVSNSFYLQIIQIISCIGLVSILSIFRKLK